MDTAQAMGHAIELAAGSSDPRPNPRVGCVILDPSGEPVGEGAHQGAGQPHAEILALRQAGGAARGATAVVSLEPCNHVGRTGPCARALIEAGVAAVVFAQADPNPQAAGGGAALRAAGIAVTGGVMAEAARALNPEWSFAQEHRRPWVIWKAAATLDGKVAAADRSSRWITGEAARAQVHELRSQVDAVIVGTATVLTDDPDLTARGSEDARQPMRVVIGQRAVPAAARIRSAHPVRNFRQIPTRDPRFALDQLFRGELYRVLLEGGPTLAGAFLRAGLIDEIRWYLAPAVLGSGVPAVPDLSITSMSGIRRFTIRGVSQVGDDVRIDMEPIAG